LTSVLAVLLILIPAFLLYSPKVEQNRVLTVTRPIVITQERKTPAYYLYQQVQAVEKKALVQPAMTTYLSSQNYVPPQTAVAVNELKVERHAIASEVDAGFSTAAYRSEPVQSVEAFKNALNSVSASSSLIADLPQPEPTRLSPSNKWATIRGKFESLGIGVIDQIIELKRIEEGQVREVGRVDLRAGLYSIDIGSPQGTLVARILDRNGSVIGEDYQRIENLVSRGNYFEGPYIRVRNSGTVASNPTLPPNRSGVASAGGANANGKRTPSQVSVQKKASGFVTTLFSGQNQLETPTDEFSNISRHSSTVSTVSDDTQAYRKVLSIRQTGDTSQTPVFSEKWVAGLLEYISDQQKIQFRSNQISIVIGRAMLDGKPVAGMQMQIENHPGVYPIYLDQFMIPNMQQTETSENGYFLFVGLEDSTYTVSAFRQNQIMGHQMFIAQEGAIGFQNIMAKTVARSVVVRAFDAFSSEPVDVDVTTPDLEEIVSTVSGTGSYRSHGDLGVTQFLVRTNERSYSPIRYFQDARKEYVHLPQIREEWLKQIQSQRLINDKTNTSTFVGFVPDMEYQVYLVHEGYSRDQIVYFDPQGRISPVPVSGGGFILYNVPDEAREIIVQQEGSDRIYSQVFQSVAGQVGVAHFAD
jgi:hypothetical protein